MHLPFRRLKQKAVSHAQPDCQFELRLIEPTLEAFMSVRLVTGQGRGGLYGLQFAREGSAEFHYTNLIDLQPTDGDGQIELFGVVDLPLERDAVWVVSLVLPGEEPLHFPYRLAVSELGAWRLMPHKKSRLVVQRTAQRTKRALGFIGGPPKSGTTWVERIINSHPAALATGENNLFGWPGGMAMEAVMAANPPPDIAVAVPQQQRFLSEVFTLHKARAQGLLSQLAAAADVQIAMDKTPGNAEQIGMIVLAFPDARIVHCLRHPMDVLVSRFFHERLILRDDPAKSLLTVKNLSPDAIEHVERVDVTTGLGRMFSNHEVLECFCRSYVDGHLPLKLAPRIRNLFIVTYEGLQTDFAATAARLFAFLDLPVDADMIENIRLQNSFSAYTGGRDSGQERQEEFFRKGVVGDHARYMTAEQVEWTWTRIGLDLKEIRSHWPDPPARESVAAG